MTTSGSPHLNQLLEHEAFLRRVATALVPRSEIEDLVQDTWATAAKAQARADAKPLQQPRAWLAAVTRRLAARRHRDRLRRNAREQAAVAARSETPSTSQMLARVEAHRELAEAVAGLDEPYREAVLLRFFEDLQPQEIARRLGVPASTVRTRIERGVTRLRGRLEHRDLRGLVALVLLPRAGERLAGTAAATSSTVTATATTQGFLMTAWFQKVGVPAGIALLFVSFLTYHFVWRADPQPAPNAPAVATATTTASGVEQNGPSPTERVAAAPTNPIPDAATQDAAPATYRVVDASGQPLADVPLLIESLPANVTFSGGRQGAVPMGTLTPAGISNAAGDATLPPASGRQRLWAGPGFCTLATQMPTANETGGQAIPGLLIAVPAKLCVGETVDEHGAALADVAVRIKAPLLVDFPDSLAGATRTALPDARSDARGRFALQVPTLPGTTITASKSGFAPARRTNFSAELLRIALHRPSAPFRISGKVVDASGSGVWGATVVLGSEQSKTGFFGGFSIETGELADEAVLLAAKAGHRPKVCRELLRKLREQRAVQDVTITLGGAPLQQEGVVLDAQGKPLEGLIVCIWQPTAIDTFTTPEDLARGQRGQLGNFDGGPAKIDAQTDAQGRFVVPGLGEQSYRYRVFDPNTLVSTTTEAVPAGSPALRVVLDVTARRTIRGIARTRDGMPAAGVRVASQLVTWQTATFTALAPVASTSTDAQGRFELRDVPAGDTSIAFSRTGLVGTTVPLAAFPQDGGHLLQLSHRCSFRVNLGATSKADHFELRDADGRALTIQRTRGSVSTSGRTWRLANGRTDILEVSEEAVELVLLQLGEEVARRPIALRVDSIAELR